MFRRLLRSRPTHNLLLLASMAISYRIVNQQRCFWPFGQANSAATVKNRIKGRMQSLQYPANDPMEDTLVLHELKQVDGYMAAVFDGHGGTQVSAYLKENFAQDLERSLELNKQTSLKEEEVIVKSIEEALLMSQNRLRAALKSIYQSGFDNSNKVGSCALVVVVANEKIYTSAVGDSQAVLLSQRKDELLESEDKPKKQTPYSYKILNYAQSANSDFEQKRLRAAFPKELDIVTCLRKSHCYVKGILQPTQAIGSFGLKDSSMRHSRLKEFTQPYIGSKPATTVHTLTPEDKYVVLASDGLWRQIEPRVLSSVLTLEDESGEQELHKHSHTDDDLCERSLDAALTRVSMELGYRTIDELKSVPVGARRKLHDDISITFITLENQL